MFLYFQYTITPKHKTVNLRHLKLPQTHGSSLYSFSYFGIQ